MNGKKAKRLRREVCEYLGLRRVPRAMRYKLRNPQYLTVVDPDTGEESHELYTGTMYLDPSEPRAVLRKYKRLVK